MKSLKTCLAICVCAFTWASGQNKVGDVKTVQLANGMKILVMEDHSIPNANMYLFWKVGSRNEVHGITGLSHFFEHMMFNGAKKYGPKMFDRSMEAAGGSNNAYTSEDVTVYTDWFPASGLETIFDLESDRIAHLNIDPKMLESERGVVLSERSTGLENSNYRFLNNEMLSVAFSEHPYSLPTIGFESDIKSWTKEDLEAYFKTYYAPNNCVMVICGDVKLAEVERLAKQYLEPIPANTPPKAIRTVEPEQNGEKRFVLYKDVSSATSIITYHVPRATSEDFYALDMLASALSSGNSSRLMKSLVFDKQLANELFSFMPQSFDPNLFTIYTVGTPEAKPEDIEKAIYEELEKIKKDGLTEKELQKIKNQKLMEFYGKMGNINDRANNIGSYELFFGDYKKLFEAPALYEKVTNEDIKRVAAKYLADTNRTVGTLIAKPAK